MPQARVPKGTEDRNSSEFLPDLPWYLPAGADGRLVSLQAEASPLFRLSPSVPFPGVFVRVSTISPQNHNNLYCMFKPVCRRSYV